MNRRPIASTGIDPSRRHLTDGARPLSQFLAQLARNRVGRRAVHLRLSGMLLINRSEQKSLMAIGFFSELVSSLQAELFVLRNNDLLLFYGSSVEGLVKSALNRLRARFSEDPLIKNDPETNGLAAWYDLETDFDAVKELAGLHAGVPAVDRAPVSAAPQPESEPAITLTPEWVARLEGSLKHLDVSSLLRERWVCRWPADSAPRREFAELSPSMEELGRRLLPNVDLRANTWLLRHLTQSIDQRVLACLSRPESNKRSYRICINLGLSTVLSAQFLTFDENLFAAMRGTIVIQLKAADVFMDLEAFDFARRLLQARQYEVSIDDFTHQTIGLVERAQLGADYLKMDFKGEMFDGGETLCNELTRITARHGVDNVILAGIETGQALMFARKAGLRWFQGNYVDHTLLGKLGGSRPGTSASGFIDSRDTKTRPAGGAK